MFFFEIKHQKTFTRYVGQPGSKGDSMLTAPGKSVLVLFCKK